MVDAYRETDFSLSLEERVQAYLASIIADAAYGGFDSGPLRHTEFIVVSAEHQTIQFNFRVLEFMCNKDGNLHGGAASTIFDNLSSTALFTIGRPGFWNNLGVTRSLSVVFHRPLPMNTSVILTSSVVSAGRRLADVQAVIKTLDGKVCATCRHEKVRVVTPSL